MPCDTTSRYDEQPTAEREDEVNEALERLEKALTMGEVTVRLSPEGSVAFNGWDAANRRGLSDLCAYRRLSSRGSSSLRFATARAEALAGRSVDENAVAAGVHSHDGGKTWGKD